MHCWQFGSMLCSKISLYKDNMWETYSARCEQLALYEIYRLKFITTHFISFFDNCYNQFWHVMQLTIAIGQDEKDNVLHV